MNTVQWLKIFPIIIDFIKALEVLFPEPGKGAEKLALLRAMLESVFSALGIIINDVWAKIEGLVATIISAFNALGIFKTSK